MSGSCLSWLQTPYVRNEMNFKKKMNVLLSEVLQCDCNTQAARSNTSNQLISHPLLNTLFFFLWWQKYFIMSIFLLQLDWSPSMIVVIQTGNFMILSNMLLNENVMTDVPQGSIIGPLLFMVYCQPYAVCLTWISLTLAFRQTAEQKFNELSLSPVAKVVSSVSIA